MYHLYLTDSADNAATIEKYRKYPLHLPYWPQSEPTMLHRKMASLVRKQLWPGVEYPADGVAATALAIARITAAVAAVDSMMREQHRFFDMDLRQIAKRLVETIGQPRYLPVPKLDFEHWYFILKTAWGWRLVELKSCPPDLVMDQRTKECRPGPDWQPEEEPPPEEPPGEEDAEEPVTGFNQWLYVAAGLAVAFVFTRR